MKLTEQKKSEKNISPKFKRNSKGGIIIPDTIRTFDEMLDYEYGERGTKPREDFHKKAYLFLIAELIKEEREKQKLTQQQLADKTGMSKSYISRIENCKINIQVATLLLIGQKGFGKNLLIEWSK